MRMRALALPIARATVLAGGVLAATVAFAGLAQAHTSSPRAAVAAVPSAGASTALRDAMASPCTCCTPACSCCPRGAERGACCAMPGCCPGCAGGAGERGVRHLAGA